MKQKSKKLFSLFIAFIFTLVFTTCDMVYISDPDNVSADSRDTGGDSIDNGGDDTGGSRFISETERDDLEKNGHFLKLVNMPLNTQTPNVYSVSVANSANVVGKFNKDKSVLIYKETNTCTVYLTLVYNDDSDFLETGFFYTAFTVHVDAVTKYIVNLSDDFLVSFTDGRGQADVNNLPSNAAIPTELRYLTIYNLPSYVSVYNFAGVSIRDQKNVVAKCDDYSQIIISVIGGKAEAKIPLVYNSGDQIFAETGSFYVLFDINVDAVTRYTLTANDMVKIPFVCGDGSLDILNIPYQPVPPVPYLTIKGLPLNASKDHISDVNVYNLAGSVADCSNYKDVIVVKDGGFLTFMVPLFSSNGGYFTDSGRFAVSFTFNIDVETKISYSKSDDLILDFVNGSAEFDVNSFFGFFEASLTNPDDFSSPVIKSGSSFEVNGRRCSVKGNYAVPATTPNSSCVLYLYVFYSDGDFFYEFSNTVPTYYPNRKGFYNGNKRALWKMIYLHSTSQFVFKTYVADDFPQLKTAAISASDFSQFAASKPVAKSIDGSSNPPADNFTLNPGVYVIELKGAGGGSGRSYNGTSSGGSGGLIREIISLNTAASFTAFTGSAGGSAPVAATSGTFDIVTTRNYYSYQTEMYSEGRLSFYRIKNLTLNTTNSVISVLNLINVNNSMSGGGGGGGGSGSFLYSSSGYLLAAGGGGGGSGGSYLTPGGGGGAGGSLGPGAGGGGSGFMSLSSDTGSGNYSAPGGAGGSGGGSGGGAGGSVANNGGSANSLFSANYSVPGGAGTASCSVSNSDISSPIPPLYYPESPYQTTASPNWVQSNTKIASVRTSFAFSGNSGSGGSTATLSYPSGSQSWLNTADIGGAGASATPLDNVSIQSYIDLSKFDKNWGSTSTLNPQLLIDLTIGAAKAANNGSNGGNNRNSTKGDGAASDSPGSVKIYKIY